jgi:hypothetical protein
MVLLVDVFATCHHVNITCSDLSVIATPKNLLEKVKGKGIPVAGPGGPYGCET